ncbi:MAG: YCF48-related protein [Nitrospirota bacterium]|nr:YCF48-related protein [Nitrospirota bacterium]
MGSYGSQEKGKKALGALVRGMIFAGLLAGLTVGGSPGTVATAQAEETWSFGDTLGVGVPFDGVFFLNANEGWITGASGVIIHTSDAGKTWAPQVSGTTHWIHSAAFADSNRGWAVGNNGLILSTEDGGKTWSTQDSGVPFDLYSVTFQDNKNGWVSGFAGTLLHTTDGGEHWVKISTDTAQWIMHVTFLKSDPSHGWAVGQGGLVLATVDGGTTWKKKNNSVRKDLYGVNFIDASRGWVVGTHGVIEFTANGGDSWVIQNSAGRDPLTWGVAGMERESNDLHSVVFINDKVGYVVGVLGIFLKTVDGGNHWTSVKSGTNLDLYGMTFPDNSHGWIVGVGGMILHS